MAKKRKTSSKRKQRGGDFLSDISNGLKSADKFLKKTQVISKGLNTVADPAGKALALIPHPAGQIASMFAPGALKTAGHIASTYGYGRLPVRRRLINY